MSWAVGFDNRHNRFIGYGVPAYCDHPDCNEEIDRGLSYVCGGEPWGGNHGCGLHFCENHLQFAGDKRDNVQLCSRCYTHRGKEYAPSVEHPDWINHILNDESWQEWRKENPTKVKEFEALKT